MKGLRNCTWPTASRPSLLMCSLAMRHERGLHPPDARLMAAYEEAVAMSEVEHVRTYVQPAPAPVEPVRPLSITSIDNVEEHIERDADDPTEVTYGVSRPECIAGESDEEFEPVEEDEHVSEVADEESEEAGLCEQ